MGLLTMVAAATALLLAGGCSLLDAKPRTEYVLVAVNGHPLPALLDSGPIMMYTDAQTFVVRTYVLRQVSGVLQISDHDFSLVTRFERTFDGESRPDFPPGEDKAEGYFHGPDSLAIFEAEHNRFEARFSGDTAVSLHDRDGQYDFVYFDFRRRR